MHQIQNLNQSYINRNIEIILIKSQMNIVYFLLKTSNTKSNIEEVP